MRRLKLIVVIIFAALLFTVVLSSCQVGGSDVILQAPKITGFRVEKLYTDYTDEEGNSGFYKDVTATMPVKNGESLFVYITYDNPSELTINRVVINGKSFKAKNFEPESTTAETKLIFTVDDVLSSTEKTFVVDRVYFINGSQSLPIESIAKGVDMSFTLNIAPEFNVKLFPENNEDAKEYSVPYYDTLTNIIPEVNFAMPSNSAPIKDDGWFFMGYFTEKDGEGLQVTNENSYYFWTDIALYAYYERVFTYEKVVLPEKKDYVYEKSEMKLVDGSYKLVMEEHVIEQQNTVIRVTGLTDTCGGYQRTLTIPASLTENGIEYPITIIGERAFQRSNRLDILQLGPLVETLEDYALYSSNLNDIEFPHGCGLKNIKMGALMSTEKLGSGKKGFTIPTTVTYVGKQAFKDSGWGKSIAKGATEPSSTLHVYGHLKHIGDQAFFGTKFVGVVLEAGMEFKPDAVDGTPYAESKYDLYFGSEAFSDCTLLKTVTIAETVGSWGDEEYLPALEFIPAKCFDVHFYSVDDTVGITSLNINEGVKYIHTEAFLYQKLLSTIKIPNSVERIEEGAFTDCSHVSKILFVNEDSQLKYLGRHAFWNNREITSVEIPSRVFEVFGHAIFMGCDNLTEVYFNFNTAAKAEQRDKAPKIADIFYANLTYKIFVPGPTLEAFKSSVNLGNKSNGASQVLSKDLIVEIHDSNYNCKIALDIMTTDQTTHKPSAYSLGYYFGDSTSIKVPDVYLGVPIKGISSMAINKNVVELTLPATIEKLQLKALAGTTKLKTLHFGDENDNGLDNLKEVGERAFYQSGITYFRAGKNLATIGLNAFWECKSLKWVDLSASTVMTTGLASQAFQKCTALEYVEMPKTLTKMDAGVFASCAVLTTVIFSNAQINTQEFWNATTPFGDIKRNSVTLYFPTNETRSLYEDAKNAPIDVLYSAQNVPTAPWDLL